MCFGLAGLSLRLSFGFASRSASLFRLRSFGFALFRLGSFCFASLSTSLLFRHPLSFGLALSASLFRLRSFGFALSASLFRLRSFGVLEGFAFGRFFGSAARCAEKLRFSDRLLKPSGYAANGAAPMMVRRPEQRSCSAHRAAKPKRRLEGLLSTAVRRPARRSN